MNHIIFCGYKTCKEGKKLKRGKSIKTVAQDKMQNKLFSTAVSNEIYHCC
jgi:hypothetical protein